MKKYILIILALLFIATPVYGATLTTNQINSIIGLLQAFGVSQTTITAVYSDLTVSQPQVQEVPIETPQPVSTPSLDFGSVSTPSLVPTCDPDPQMILATTSGNFGRNVGLNVKYQTGCPLDVTTPFSITMSLGTSSPYEDDGGTLSYGNDGPTFTTVSDWTYSEPANYILGTTFTVTIGTTTQTIQ